MVSLFPTQRALLSIGELYTGADGTDSANGNQLSGAVGGLLGAAGNADKDYTKSKSGSKWW